MNERLAELEKQCWSHRVQGALVDGQLHFDTAKFARLIVQECVEINKQELAFNAFEQLMNRYQEHFGVEQ
jgi:hypothetical protein